LRFSQDYILTADSDELDGPEKQIPECNDRQKTRAKARTGLAFAVSCLSQRQRRMGSPAVDVVVSFWREQGHSCVKFQDTVYVLSPDILYTFASWWKRGMAAMAWVERKKLSKVQH
jgi:hypothetical protein